MYFPDAGDSFCLKKERVGGDPKEVREVQIKFSVANAVHLYHVIRLRK
jgi:hypothetical protein|tara:strand:+ start:164 stop:307 length:144 start_codon:yes stop_codon:yes gene_type:complete